MIVNLINYFVSITLVMSYIHYWKRGIKLLCKSTWMSLCIWSTSHYQRSAGILLVFANRTVICGKCLGIVLEFIILFQSYLTMSRNYQYQTSWNCVRIYLYWFNVCIIIGKVMIIVGIKSKYCINYNIIGNVYCVVNNVNGHWSDKLNWMMTWHNALNLGFPIPMLLKRSLIHVHTWAVSNSGVEFD